MEEIWIKFIFMNHRQHLFFTLRIAKNNELDDSGWEKCPKEEDYK